jgi:hypothetical protein
VPFVQANPSQFLLVGRGGKVVNLGVAASAYVWPGSAYVCIPSNQQEAAFEMTQESRDGIPLRFKGLVVYRVADPLAVARLFDFSSGDGHAGIKVLISQLCLGELRAVVAHMTMQECIEQRKTTLSEAVAAALRRVAERSDEGLGWGIELDVVQVAQVFIVDSDLRRQLEAERRNEIRSASDLSDLHLKEELQVAQSVMQRRLQQQALELTREKVAIDREKLQLEKGLEREKLEADVPLRQFEIESQARLRLEADQAELQRQETMRLAQMVSDRRVQQEALEADREKAAQEREKLSLRLELERDQLEKGEPLRRQRLDAQAQAGEKEVVLRRLESEARALAVEGEMADARAKHALRRVILPIEQMPALAEAVGRLFQGANLTIYGDQSPLLAAVAPLVEWLSRTLQERMNAARRPDHLAGE